MNTMTAPPLKMLEACLLLVALNCLAPSSCSGWTTYSTGYGDGAGYIYGVGVTDVSTTLYCCHTAYATPTLTDPSGHSTYTEQSAHNSVTVDLRGGAAADGVWKVSTTHYATCLVMGVLIDNTVTNYLFNVGHSENWFKYDHYDSLKDFCVYKIISPCVTTCQPSDGNEQMPTPCSNGQDNLTYLLGYSYYYYFSSGPKHCFFVDTPITTSKTVGVCKDSG